jgi:hypothetical protein
VTPEDRRRIEEDQRRKAWMFSRYGKPEPFDLDTAVNLARLTDNTITRDDICAFTYRDREAFEAYAENNRQINQLGVIGPFDVAGAGLVGVIDLRPAIKRMSKR